MFKAHSAVAGTSPELGNLVRAVQAVAMLSEPIILLTDVPTETLRREILAGVRRLFGAPSRRNSHQRRVAGRPTVITPDMISEAKRLHGSGLHTMEDIAVTLGVSRATLYRALRHEILRG